MDLPEQIPADEHVREKIEAWAPPESSNEEHLVSRAMRETVEFAVMVIILWLLLRAFEVEPFVIPTGSMAPTLMGRHVDVECDQCGFEYMSNASKENDNGKRNTQNQIVDYEVNTSVCPICRYEMDLDRDERPNQDSFSGDRILVSKLAYQLRDPRRWEVAVFKFPGDPKINYIKRLVGLPGETVTIKHGDIYIEDKDGNFRIARKSPDKLKQIMQTVDDTRYIAETLKNFDWPSRWQPWPDSGPHLSSWQEADDGKSFALDGNTNRIQWLRYRHIVPDSNDWRDMDAGQKPRGANRAGQLISDFYAYNNYSATRFVDDVESGDDQNSNPGLHWVGDLALEFDAHVKSDSGQLLLDLVEGGVHFQCRIDVATGVAALWMDDKPKGYWGSGDELKANPTAKTSLTHSGKYTLRFSNCDDELQLWIDDDLVKFDGPTTYHRAGSVVPKWNEDDPLDLAPVGIGGESISLSISGLRVLRDVYYIASKYDIGNSGNQSDYDITSGFGRYDQFDIVEIFRSPKLWKTTKLFDARRSASFSLGQDQFFTLGDNSPESKDARVWSDWNGGTYQPPPFVERKFLTGKAFMVYWPHTWNRPIPFWPNFKRISFIR